MNEHEVVAALMRRDEVLLMALVVIWGAIALFALTAAVWTVLGKWYD